MFNSTSRYSGIKIVTLNVTHADGLERKIRFIKRRFIPSNGTTTLLEHTVTQGERLDNITAKYLGDPTQFWRICDANYVMRPNELTDTVGSVIEITMPRL